MVSFADALDTNVSDVEAAPILPVGTYLWEIVKDNEIRQAGEDWEVVSFACRCVSAEDDVDEDEIEEFGDPAGEFGRYEFMAPTAAGKEGERGRANTMDRVKKFCVDVLQLDEDGTMKELLEGVKGCQFLAQVTHRENKNSGEMNVQLKGAAPAD